MSERAPTSGWTENPGVHVFPVRVYFEDTDSSGIVYHANHLRYAERARTEMLRLSGHGQRTMFEELGLGFSVRRCEIDYLAPAHLDDALEVHSSLTQVGGASLRLMQIIRRGETDLARLVLRVACVTREGRPARLPGTLRAAFDPLAQNR